MKIQQATNPWNIPFHEDYWSIVQCVLHVYFPLPIYSVYFLKSGHLEMKW